MEQDALEQFKQKLAAELNLVEAELSSVGAPSKEAAFGWEARITDTDTASTEPDEKADKYEELEENEGIVRALSARLASIKHALRKIQNGSYGTCEVCGKEIEHERLEANPAARTCAQHIEEEKNLL